MRTLDIAAVVQANVPVLCVDTCSILDLMRDPTRDTVLVRDRRAAIDLLSAGESGALVCLLAEQVAFELAANLPEVQRDAEQALATLKSQLNRIDEVAIAYGSSGRADISHLDDHVVRALGVVNRWEEASIKATQSAEIAGRAFVRVNQARTPARKGKESMKDCVVIETYLDECTQLRSSGFSCPIVFLSSNTKEYLNETRNLKSDIAGEFAALGVEFASSFSAAKHFLSA